MVYKVQPIVVRSLQLNGAKVLTYQVANKYFASQIGKAISPQILKQGVEKINQWYLDNDYKLARVLSIKPDRQGILTMNVAEGVVGDIEFIFLNDDDKTIDKKGKPIKGRTKTDFLKKQIQLKNKIQLNKQNSYQKSKIQLQKTKFNEKRRIQFKKETFS